MLKKNCAWAALTQSMLTHEMLHINKVCGNKTQSIGPVWMGHWCLWLVYFIQPADLPFLVLSLLGGGAQLVMEKLILLLQIPYVRFQFLDLWLWTEKNSTLDLLHKRKKIIPFQKCGLVIRSQCHSGSGSDLSFVVSFIICRCYIKD